MIKVQSVLRAIPDLWDLRDLKVTVEKRETVVPPVSRDQPEYKVLKANSVLRVFREIRVAPVPRANRVYRDLKVLPVQRVIPASRDLKEIKVI